jgi:NADH-quinone oxidoreductase subunit C
MEVTDRLKQRCAEMIIETVEFRGQVSVTVKRDRMLDVMGFLRSASDLSFDFLVALCGVDYLGRKTPRFEVVYNLLSIRHRHAIRIKVPVPEETCFIDSVVPLWAGANWHERECYDLFGIEFRGHPDLRRILMPDDWTGHPLRKDYPIQSDLGEAEWTPFLQVREAAERNKIHEVH